MAAGALGGVFTGWPRLPDSSVVFTTARGEREAALMAELKQLAPDARILPQIAELPLFLAVLARAGVFISGDTGPLHFAAGLGVPTISLFGPDFSSALGADWRTPSDFDWRKLALAMAIPPSALQ